MSAQPEFLINAIGVAAGIASTASFIPQLLKILRERSAASVSLKMFALTATSFALWATFGLLTGAWPLACANIACFALAAAILALRVRFGDGEGKAVRRRTKGGGRV